MSISYNFNKHTVIVTGSSRGNGHQIAKSFLDSGAIVVGIDCLPPEESLHHVTNYYHVYFDLACSEKIASLIDNIYKEVGPIHILVNNAGITRSKPLMETTLEDWSDVINVNLTSVFMLCKSIVKYMDDSSKNSIIGVTSLASQLGFPNNSAYAASKGGMAMLMKSFAREFGEQSIRFNCIAPGYIRTSMTKKTFDNSQTRQERAASSMLNRWGQPSDLIGAVMFLASEASSFITGQEIKVDGGWTTNGLPHWNSVDIC